MSFFRRKDTSSNTSTLSPAMTRGREVIRGRLWIRKGKTTKRVPAEVVGYCGTHDCQTAGQIEIFEESSKNYQKPKRVISLLDIRRDPGVQAMTPCSPLSCSPASPHGSSFLGTSPSATQTGMLWPFQIVLSLGEVIEFFLESPEDQKQWMKRLGLLLMFPYSPIPEEPSHTFVKDSFKAKLNAKDYGADSVWAVYVLAEEVGSRIHALGVNIVALRSRVSEKQPGRLDIISPVDSHSIVSWDRDKMRRTGCLGNLVFIEIGRRCIGGPGLVWLYAGPREACALRQTLHSFLFDGDGRAVAINASPNHFNGTPRASFDHSLPSSYSRRCSGQESPGQPPHVRQLSVDSQAEMDSGSLGHSPSSGVPPPVDLSSHPNRRRSQRISDPITYNSKTQSENTTELDSGIASHQSSMRSESDASQFDMEPDQGSVDTIDEGVGDMEIFGNLDDDGVPPLQRNNSVPEGPYPFHRPVQRSLTTSTCQPSLRGAEYMRMINPRYNMAKDDYVLMQPATAMGPNCRSAVPREGVSRQTKNQTIYENHAVPSDAQFVDYHPNYENVHKLEQRSQLHVKDLRRGSDGQLLSSLKNGPSGLTGSRSSTSLSRSPLSSTDLVEKGHYDVPVSTNHLVETGHYDVPASANHLVETGHYDIPCRRNHMDDTRMASSPSPVIINTP